MKAIALLFAVALGTLPIAGIAKDCEAVCKNKEGKTERTMKWTCKNDQSCSGDCTTGKTACADPVTLKPIPQQGSGQEKKK